MRYIRLTCLTLVAVGIVAAVSAGAASAVPQYIYKVALKKLEAGEEKEIRAKLKAGSEFTIKGKGPLNVAWIVKCTGFKLDPAEKPTIVGGIPGESKKEFFEFEGCTATVGGSKCSSLEGASAETNDELVSVVMPAAKAGKLANWFAPDNEAKKFIVLKLNKCGIFGSQKAEINGTTAALIVPEAVEGIALTWVWREGAEEITEIERHNGEKFNPNWSRAKKRKGYIQWRNRSRTGH